MTREDPDLPTARRGREWLMDAGGVPHGEDSLLGLP